MPRKLWNEFPEVPGYECPKVRGTELVEVSGTESTQSARLLPSVRNGHEIVYHMIHVPFHDEINYSYSKLAMDTFKQRLRF